MDKRRYNRFSTRLHVKLSSPSILCWGILCDVSRNGLFIKSNQDVAIGEMIDIEIFMADKTSCLLNGIVKRKIELSESYRRNGLGVHLIGKDTDYERFLKRLNGQAKITIHEPSTVR